MRWFEVVSVAALLSGGPALAGPPAKPEGRCGKLEMVASPSAVPATFTCRAFGPDGAPLATLPLAPSHEAWVTRDGACVVTGGEGTIGLFRRGGAKAAVVTTPPRVMTALLDREGRRLLVMHGQGATLLAIP